MAKSADKQTREAVRRIRREIRLVGPDYLCTTSEAAELMDLSPVRLRQFVSTGRLRGRKVGPVWLISLADLRNFADIPRRTGHPFEHEPPREPGYPVKVPEAA